MSNIDINDENTWTNNIQSAQIGDIIYDPSTSPKVLAELTKKTLMIDGNYEIEYHEITSKLVKSGILSDFRLWSDIPD